MDSRLLCDALFVPQHLSHKLVTPRTPWGARIFPARFESGFNNTQLCCRESKSCGRTLGSTIRSPLTGSDADHAAIQASGIENSVVDGCESKFHTDLRENNLWSVISNICSYRRDLACLLQVTSSWTVKFFWLKVWYIRVTIVFWPDLELVNFF
jgi:hypothetical protein